jgi:hypothetical protein
MEPALCRAHLDLKDYTATQVTHVVQVSFDNGAVLSLDITFRAPRRSSEDHDETDESAPASPLSNSQKLTKKEARKLAQKLKKEKRDADRHSKILEKAAKKEQKRRPKNSAEPIFDREFGMLVDVDSPRVQYGLLSESPAPDATNEPFVSISQQDSNPSSPRSALTSSASIILPRKPRPHSSVLSRSASEDLTNALARSLNHSVSDGRLPIPDTAKRNASPAVPITEKPQPTTPSKTSGRSLTPPRSPKLSTRFRIADGDETSDIKRLSSDLALKEDLSSSLDRPSRRKTEKKEKLRSHHRRRHSELPVSLINPNTPPPRPPKPSPEPQQVQPKPQPQPQPLQVQPQPQVQTQQQPSQVHAVHFQSQTPAMAPQAESAPLTPFDVFPRHEVNLHTAPAPAPAPAPHAPAVQPHHAYSKSVIDYHSTPPEFAIDFWNNPASFANMQHLAPHDAVTSKTPDAHVDAHANSGNPFIVAMLKENPDLHKKGSLVGGNTQNVEEWYQIKTEIGKGTYGSVLLAQHRYTGEEVAIKFLSKRIYSTSREKVQREVAIMKQVNHPNIVRLYEVFETKDNIILVMELVRGGELFDRVVQLGHYHERIAMKLIHDVLKAIAYLHQSGVIHRDLKPENILLTSSGSDASIKVADFGLAVFEPQAENTLFGTPGYIAPEVLMRRPYNEKIDIYAVGTITYIL